MCAASVRAPRDREARRAQAAARRTASAKSSNAREHVGPPEVVRAVGIDRDHHVFADFGPHCRDDFAIGTGLDLQLEPPVSRPDVRGREGAKFGIGIGQTDRDAGGHVQPRRRRGTQRMTASTRAAARRGERSRPRTGRSGCRGRRRNRHRRTGAARDGPGSPGGHRRASRPRTSAPPLPRTRPSLLRRR